VDPNVTEDPGMDLTTQRVCPACGVAGRALGFSITGIPVNSVRIHSSAAEARSVRRGDMDLCGCAACSFVWNAAFDENAVDYSAGYEATQTYSGTYRAFMQAQAARFIESFALTGGRIIEIGCGHGEFLAAVCEMGGNVGIGFDPAFRPDRAPTIQRGQYTVRAEKFSRETAVPEADLICCRNTLEHLPDVQVFVRDLRQALGSDRSPRIVFQVPAWERIKAHGAFWDIYYEHCSYFSARSLEILFASNGFSVERIERVFEDQYLLIEARVDGMPNRMTRGHGRDGALQADVGNQLRASQKRWTELLDVWRRSGRKTVLWGGGSKAVAFLSAVGTDGIDAVVDINPNKWRTYLPCSALPVLSPEDLRTLQPNEVIVMNAAYAREIADQLAAMGLGANLSSLD
jgi:SAM-dependent methyltransferase